MYKIELGLSAKSRALNSPLPAVGGGMKVKYGNLPLILCQFPNSGFQKKANSGLWIQRLDPDPLEYLKTNLAGVKLIFQFRN